MRDSAADIGAAIKDAEKELGLDWRTSWSKVAAGSDGILSVAVSRREVLESLAGKFDETGRIMLELAGQGNSAVLLAVSSVVDVRRAPEHSSELLTQAIMGETMTRLDSRGDWYLVMLDDGYHGWVRSWYVIETSRDTASAYLDRADSVVGASVDYVLMEPRAGSIPVSDITAGSRLITGEAIGDYTAVELPGGREGFVATGSLEQLPSGRPRREDILDRARRFIGIPYIWGGTSAKGFDCSGLVKRVFRMEGVETARDADQQSAAGAAVDTASTASEERIPEADLLFFGEGGRINHVAISLGGGRFIHSYGDVRINSLLKIDELYEEKLAGIFLFACDLLALYSV